MPKWIITWEADAEFTRQLGLRSRVGFRSCDTPRTMEAKQLPRRFRLLTDDRDVEYEGRADESCDFEPLDDFGAPDAGCTIIEYWEPGNGWVAL